MLYEKQYVTHWLVVTAQDHGDGRGDGMIDVDPEIIRKGVRSLMQQVAQIERERVR
jgi:rootletin